MNGALWAPWSNTLILNLKAPKFDSDVQPGLGIIAVICDRGSCLILWAGSTCGNMTEEKPSTY